MRLTGSDVPDVTWCRGPGHATATSMGDELRDDAMKGLT
jgi:hypothetical protein